MTTVQLAAELTVVLGDDSLILSGELTQANGAVLERWLEDLPPVAVLELGGLDIIDGVACTHALNAVRLLHSRVPQLRIEQSPQALAHNLYRTGLLLDGSIELKDMREDEAYG
jgi:hypothetical protein